MSKLKRPWYWRGLGSAMLQPASLIYRAAQNRRNARRREQPHELPLLVVGNPRVGGSGKTPISIDAVERLRRRGVRAAWIGRGVGGDSKPRQVTDAHGPKQVGDEARMAQAQLVSDCFAGVPRSGLIGQAHRHGCAAAVSDDGMQSPDLRPDKLVVVLRAEDPWGNGKRLPAGPLREGPECLERADIVVWHGLDLGPQPLPTEADERWVGAHYDVEVPRLEPGQPFGLVSGIADPERLLRSLAAAGLEPTTQVFRGDHRALPLADLDREMPWITTSKDLARHPDRPEGLDLRPMLVRLRWADDGAAIDALLADLVDSGAAGQ